MEAEGFGLLDCASFRLNFLIGGSGLFAVEGEIADVLRAEFGEYKEPKIL